MIKIKKILALFIIILSIHGVVLGTDKIIETQLEILNISSFIKEGKKYTKDVYKDIDLNEIFNQALTGKIDNNKLYKKILSLFSSEITNSIKVVSGILIIIVIHSILKSIAESLGNSEVSNITYYVEYILIVSLIMGSFAEIIKQVENSIINMVGYLNSLVPILLALIVSTGGIATGGILQPILLTAIIFIGNTITIAIIPIVVISTIMGIISNISDKVNIKKISKFLQSSTLWALGVITTIFISALSLEGSLGGAVDGVAVKGIKAATSGLVPVVGKTLSDSVGTVLGCTGIIKNAVGFFGIVVILGIVSVPIIKLTVLTFLYSLTSAISEPIADKRIVNVLEQISNSFKFLLGIMFFISMLFIVGIAIILKLSNSQIMMG